MDTWFAFAPSRLGTRLREKKTKTPCSTDQKKNHFALVFQAMSAPSDVLALILQRLDLVDFCAAASTCHSWHAAARKKTAWPKTVVRSLVLRLPGVTTRPLSATVWAACTNLSLKGNSFCATPLLFERIGHELVHVSTLSFTLDKRVDIDDAFWAPHTALLSRLTTLHTNIPSLVKATASYRLASLFVGFYSYDYDWGALLSTCSLASLTHVRIKFTRTLSEATSLGRALARLAHQHHTLCSIQFGQSFGNPHEILDGLLENPDLDLSSIHTLVNVPAYLIRVLPMLEHLPSLTAIQDKNHFKPTQLPPLVCRDDDMPRPVGLISLDLVSYGANYEAWLNAHLVHLTELSIIEHVPKLTGPYARLRRLRLPLNSPRHCQDLSCFAPNLEQLALVWVDAGSNRDIFSRLANLQCMPHLSHVELWLPVDRPWWNLSRNTLTLALLINMLHARCWRQVTCSAKPVSVYLDNKDARLVSLEHVRWHVMRSSTRLDTYRPRIRVVNWRRWLPGLRAKQVVWELCLRV
jgi:hypothetical protein